MKTEFSSLTETETSPGNPDVAYRTKERVCLPHVLVGHALQLRYFHYGTRNKFILEIWNKLNTTGLTFARFLFDGEYAHAWI